METIKSNLNKAMRFALMFFIMAAVATTFTACGDDDDEPGIDGDLIGTWTYSGTDFDGDRVNTSMTFKKDGSCILHEEFPDYPEDNYTATVSYSVTGDLSSGATLRLWGWIENGEEDFGYDATYRATISGKSLTLVGISGEGKGDRLTLTRN